MLDDPETFVDNAVLGEVVADLDLGGVDPITSMDRSENKFLFIRLFKYYLKLNV